MRAAGWRVSADARAIRGRVLQALVVIMRDADEHANVRALIEIEHQACVFDGLIRRFEQQALLRINVRCLTRRDAEELWIKLINAFDEATAFSDGLADDTGSAS